MRQGFRDRLTKGPAVSEAKKKPRSNGRSGSARPVATDADLAALRERTRRMGEKVMRALEEDPEAQEELAAFSRFVSRREAPRR